MAGIAFEQTDLAEALEDLLTKRGLGREGGYTLEWYINATAPANKQITAVCTPIVHAGMNKKKDLG